MKFYSIKAYFLIVVIVLFYLSGCKKEPTVTPKPKGYFRLDLPAQQYRVFDTIDLPFTFQYSSAANYTFEKKNDAMWIHVRYPQLKAVLEMTYIPVNHNFRELLLNDEELVKVHYVKADNVENSYVKDDSASLYGKIYDISGKEVACPLQFWLSDTTHHYLHSSLYFEFSPNNDSLQPVIQYIRNDVMKMINTFEWKKQ